MIEELWFTVSEYEVLHDMYAVVVGRSLLDRDKASICTACLQVTVQSDLSHPGMDRIDSVEVFILKAPLGKAKFWSSQSSFPERNSLLVRITSGGECGWGEAGQYGPPEPVASAIKVRLENVTCRHFVLLTGRSSRENYRRGDPAVCHQ